MNERQCASGHDHAAVGPARDCRDGALDFAGTAQVDRDQLHPQRRRHRLNSGELPDPGRDGRIAKDGGPRQAGRDLFEQLQPFSAHTVFEDREPSRVAARLCQTRDETGADRIDDTDEYDWHRACRL